MDQLENPFRPGAGTEPPALLGRDELIDSFGITMRRALRLTPGKSVIPIGLRGVGKTVLLNRFMTIADEEGLKTAFIEAPETLTFRRQLAIRLRKLLLGLETGPAKKAATFALGVLKSFSMQLPDGSSIQLGVGPIAGSADSGLLSEDLTDVMVAVGEAVAADGSGFVLAIDEIQYLTSDELGALISAVHRTTQLNLPVVLVGAGLPQIPGLAGEAKSYAERLFEFPEISELVPLDAMAALQIPANGLDTEFHQDALEQIVRESHGYPYFLQEWGYHVWNAAPGRVITLDDVVAAGPGVITTLDQNFFKVRLDRLTPKERDYMLAMAQLGPGPHRSGEIAERLGVRVESVGPRRSGLIVKGMVYSPAHGDTAFTVPLFDEFLLRTLPNS